MKIAISILILILTSRIGLASCAADDRTLTEKLFKGLTGNVFIGKVLTSDQKENGSFYSTVEIIETIFGLIDSDTIIINTGNLNASTGGTSLTIGEKYIVYSSGRGNNFSCCSICDQWTKQLTQNRLVENELKILRQFKDIFKLKKTGQFDFLYSNGNLASTGHFTNGIATGDWKHFYDNDSLKSTYDLDENVNVNYSKNGFVISKNSYSENVTTTEQYSKTKNGLLEFKLIETKNDTGSYLQVTEYFDNGNVKEIHGPININIRGGSTSTGKEGLYEEYY